MSWGRGVRKGGGGGGGWGARAPPHTDNAHSIRVPRLDSQAFWRKANVAF